MQQATSRELLRHYVAYFNAVDDESIIQAIPNTHALEWMNAHIPRVRLPDPMLEQTYYFRWWTYRKHIKHTPDGWVITEFHPDVPWAGKHNTIIASGCHHIDEGRWLRDTPVLDEYIRFFYQKGGSLRAYSNWMEDSVLGYSAARGTTALAESLLDDMIANHAGWDSTNLHESGLYWSNDDRDASEFSISGHGLRPTLNCYQVANERAIALTARRMGRHDIAQHYDALADALTARINTMLWNEADSFYKVIPLHARADRLTGEPVDPRRDVREIWGYLPWRFAVAPQGRAQAFRQLLHVNGFRAAHGLTTAERRHPGFGLFYTGDALNAWLQQRDESPIGPKGHECLWNGPSWPFSTCFALRALSNLLSGEEATDAVSAADYVRLLAQYAAAHVRRLDTGRFIPWIDENLNPDTGDWISRTRLMTWDNGHWSDDKGGYERGKDYNHSTFADLVIGGLFGIQPTLKDVHIVPLFPTQWPYAALEDVPVHGHLLSILYDAPRLGGQGYRIFVDGSLAKQVDTPQAFTLDL